MTNVNEIEAALRHLDSQDRDQWVRMGAAIKTELGDDGFNVWDAWSQGSDNYKKNDAKSVWKSIKAGKINIGTLFYEARRNGYNPTEPFKAPTHEQLEARRQAQETSRLKAEQERAQEMATAVEIAAERWNNAQPLKDLTHPYLVKKGIDDPILTRQLRMEGNSLLLPLKKEGRIVGLQEINEKGGKYFTKGMDFKGASMVIGSWSAGQRNGIVLTEGYATAASIHKATGKTCIVCFTGNNLASVAERLPKADIPILIAADVNDYKGAGLKYAHAAKEVLGDKSTVIAPTFTEADIHTFKGQHNSTPSDFNDLHKLHGTDAVHHQITQHEVSMNQPTQNTPQNNATPSNKETQELAPEAAPPLAQQQQEQVQPHPELTQPEEENSLTPDFERLIAEQHIIKKQADVEQNTQTSESEKSSASTSKQETEMATEPKKEAFDLKKEFNKPLVTDLDYDHPPGELKAKYLCTKKGDYLDKTGVVQFKDKGAKLTSPKTDLETIQDMLSVAEAKGWDKIKASGTKEFRRAVYLEANARGIAVSGYKPDEKDLAILAQMREERASNTLEQATESIQEQNAKTAQAQNFHQEPRQAEQQQHEAATLADALKGKDVQLGDRVELHNLGRKEVEVRSPIFDKDGKTVIGHETKTAHRNFWQADVHERANPEKESEKQQGVSDAQIRSEKDKMLSQNMAPSTAQITTSAKVDVDADIPMQNVGGQSIQSELKAFTDGLTPKQQGLNKASLAKLQSYKSVARMMLSGLKREDRQTAIRNFNDNMDKAIDGNTLNLPGHVPTQQERTDKVIATKEQHQQREEELTR